MDFCVSHCLAWAPGISAAEEWREWARGSRNPAGEGVPKSAKVPPMLRRRLTQWGRLALEAGAELAGEIRADTPVIFSSRHGDTALTQQLLRDLAQNEPLSPTSFSLSVHNAAVGLFTIIEKITAPSLALAAGCESFAYAWLEARTWLDEGAPQVLLMYAEEPLSGFYEMDTGEREPPLGIAVLLSATTGVPLHLATTAITPSQTPDSQPSLALEFLSWWHGDSSSFNYTGDRLLWTWERRNDPAA